MNQKPNPVLKRSGCLSAFIIFVILLNILTVVIYFFFQSSVKEVNPGFDVSFSYAYGLLGLLNIFFAWQVWNWKKIGIYGFFATATVIYILNISIGLNPITTLLGFGGPLILYLLVRKNWQEMG